METFDGCFEEAVDLVGTGELEQGAEDLWGAERGACWWEGGSVEVADEGLKGEEGVGEVEDAWSGGRWHGVCGGDLEVRE